ncbi:MAG: hypothetical protein WC799_02000 [Desulfobacteraceae bacterium]|jgi:hypothetical protein
MFRHPNDKPISFEENTTVTDRVKATIKGGYTVTASAMLDHWSDEGNASLRLLALELASTRGLVSLPGTSN